MDIKINGYMKLNGLYVQLVSLKDDYTISTVKLTSDKDTARYFSSLILGDKQKVELLESLGAEYFDLDELDREEAEGVDDGLPTLYNEDEHVYKYQLNDEGTIKYIQSVVVEYVHIGQYGEREDKHDEFFIPSGGEVKIQSFVTTDDIDKAMTISSKHPEDCEYAGGLFTDVDVREALKEHEEIEEFMHSKGVKHFVDRVEFSNQDFGGAATGAFLHYLMDYSTPKGDSNGLCED